MQSFNKYISVLEKLYTLQLLSPIGSMQFAKNQH